MPKLKYKYFDHIVWFDEFLFVAPTQAFFLCTSKKTEAKKLSFSKKLRPENEKKLKTEAKKLR